ncbi:MAG: hypothetical protein LBR73_04955 [Oscillospiraceae bacterium]|jgi:hypothetical protein|nr:hypothetical protein [Oscillospiraceae bacterium]
MKENRIHVAFGFHVNCYHSYRGDSNDATGFGGDIRIIRKIIAGMDDLNAQGIPVKGTWDFENAYSLERILPEYAPDIIENVRRRCRSNGDENILMGYSNGALGAMTAEEFDASIQMAVSNPAGSGLQDLFGGYAPLMRPQEFMFSPAQVQDYNRNGLALCLYYSCVPFDGFRTLIPQLEDTYAFNPLTFRYGEENLTVLPTYSNADVFDAGCLRAWVQDLRAKQCAGEVNHDLLIFINMDADAVLWEPMNVPFPLNKLSNTQGIVGYAMQVADLEYVVFDTPWHYMQSHPALKSITFGQDTADGSFTGYASWAEKPFNRLIWSRIEKARRLAEAADSHAGFAERLLLLSTTHFGLASPHLNIQRERKALELSETMLAKASVALPETGSARLLLSGAGEVYSLQLSFAPGYLPDIRSLSIQAEGLRDFGAAAGTFHPDGSVAEAFCVLRFQSPASETGITFTVVPTAPAPAQTAALPTGLSWRGYIEYGKRIYPLRTRAKRALPCAGSAAGVEQSGDILLPNCDRRGRFAYKFFSLPDSETVYAVLETHYPHTPERDGVSTESSALGRSYDAAWREVVPFELSLPAAPETVIHKRDFAGRLGAYLLASFAESVPANAELDAFNNHLTCGIVGAAGKEKALLISNARMVNGSMAHCPMRLRAGRLYLNPFGTYHGKQRVHPSRAKGIFAGAVREAFVMVTPQSRSLAPAYNGASETAFLALRTDTDCLPEAAAFADGAMLRTPPGSPVWQTLTDSIRRPAPVPAPEGGKKLKSVLVSGELPPLPKIAALALRAFGNMVLQEARSKR